MRNTDLKKQRNVENYETGKKVYDGRIQTDREQTSRFAKLTSAAHIGYTSKEQDILKKKKKEEKWSKFKNWLKTHAAYFRVL